MELLGELEHLKGWGGWAMFFSQTVVIILGYFRFWPTYLKAKAEADAKYSTSDAGRIGQLADENIELRRRMNEMDDRHVAYRRACEAEADESRRRIMVLEDKLALIVRQHLQEGIDADANHPESAPAN